MKERIERIVMFIIVAALFVTMAAGLVVIADKMVWGAAMILIPLAILLIFGQEDDK